MKAYAIQIMGKDKPIYVKMEDVAKIVKSINVGAKMVMVGQNFVNPASISSMTRAYDISESEVETPDEEMVALISGKDVKKLT